MDDVLNWAGDGKKIGLDEDGEDYDESILEETRFDLDSKSLVDPHWTRRAAPVRVIMPDDNNGREFRNCGPLSTHVCKPEEIKLIDTRYDAANGINVPGHLLVRGRMVKPAYSRMQEYDLNSDTVKVNVNYIEIWMRNEFGFTCICQNFNTT